MNIAQLISKDRKSRLESLVPGQSNDNSNMSFIKNILNNADEAEDGDQEQYYVPAKQINQVNKTAEIVTMPKSTFQQKPISNEIAPNKDSQSISLNINYDQLKRGNSIKIGEISKLFELQDQALPRPVLAQNFWENYYKPNRDIEARRLEQEINLQSKLNMNRGLYGVNWIANSLHNNYYNNNVRLNSGLVAGSKSIPIGPRYTPGWHKMTLNEKIILQQKRKAYESEKEENDEATKCNEIKIENKRRRRELKKNEKYTIIFINFLTLFLLYREELEQNQKELQKDMDNRFIKYIKDKKRKQRHFMEEQVGRTHDTRMWANGWMKTNFEEKPKDTPVDISKMIDLDFDPSSSFQNNKNVKRLSLQKDEGIVVGATHLKHEIEEANMLTNSSVKDESSRNIEVISDVEVINTNIVQKEKIRTEVKERVRKLHKEGKLDGDSESIEEILIESKRDQIKRKDNKRAKITKAIIRGTDILSDSYEGSHEEEIKENQAIPVQDKEASCIIQSCKINNNSNNNEVKQAQEYLEANSSYIKDLPDFDEDNILENIRIEEVKIWGTITILKIWMFFEIKWLFDLINTKYFLLNKSKWTVIN